MCSAQQYLFLYQCACLRQGCTFILSLKNSFFKYFGALHLGSFKLFLSNWKNKQEYQFLIKFGKYVAKKF
jgi:hypothetical protein